ncbi:hypothetical protein ABEH20_26240 [Pantoea agglomerans]
MHALNLAIRDVSGKIKRRGAGQKMAGKTGQRTYRMNTTTRPGSDILPHTFLLLLRKSDLKSIIPEAVK